MDAKFNWGEGMLVLLSKVRKMEEGIHHHYFEVIKFINYMLLYSFLVISFQSLESNDTVFLN